MAKIKMHKGVIMAQGLVPKVEALNLEDFELDSEGGFQNENSCQVTNSSLANNPNPRTIMNFLDDVLTNHDLDNHLLLPQNLDLFSLHDLTHTAMVLRTALIELSLHSVHFWNYMVPQYICQMYQTFAQNLGNLLKYVFDQIEFKWEGGINIINMPVPKRQRNKIKNGILTLVHLIRELRLNDPQFGSWDLPEQFLNP